MLSQGFKHLMSAWRIFNVGQFGDKQWQLFAEAVSTTEGEAPAEPLMRWVSSDNRGSA